MNWFNRYKLHILFWLVYFVFWTLLSTYQYHTPSAYALLATTIWFIGQACLLYASVYWLLPRFFAGKRYGLFILLTLAALVVCSAFIAGLAGIIFHHVTPSFNLGFFTFFFYIFLNNFSLAGIVLAIALARADRKAEKRRQTMEKERTENELRFLKSQVNPHFLFNAINSIYVLIKKDPALAAATLARFADMLRYQLYECNGDKISIEKELAYLENYIGLEKLRKADDTDTVFSVGAQVQQFSIAPLLIIPFVENAFKHMGPGINGEKRIAVEMQYNAGVFHLQVENTIDAQVIPAVQKEYGGIGLENVRRRLELIYPGRHTLLVNTGNNVYSVALQIKIAI